MQFPTGEEAANGNVPVDNNESGTYELQINPNQQVDSQQQEL
jgi:hypothetical protein